MVSCPLKGASHAVRKSLQRQRRRSVQSIRSGARKVQTGQWVRVDEDHSGKPSRFVDASQGYLNIVIPGAFARGQVPAEEFRGSGQGRSRTEGLATELEQVLRPLDGVNRTGRECLAARHSPNLGEVMLTRLERTVARQRSEVSYEHRLFERKQYHRAFRRWARLDATARLEDHETGRQMAERNPV